MDRWVAQYKFWSSFGIPAYEENNVPDLRQVTFPYITYQAAAGGFGDIISITASIWDTDVWTRLDALTDEIEHAIRTMNPVAFDGGMYRVWIGDTTFAQNMGDPDNDRIRRKILNVNFEFMQIKI